MDSGKFFAYSRIDSLKNLEEKESTQHSSECFKNTKVAYCGDGDQPNPSVHKELFFNITYIRGKSNFKEKTRPFFKERAVQRNQRFEHQLQSTGSQRKMNQ